MRVASKEETLAFLQFAREYHEGKHQLPAEIVKVKREIGDAIRKAEMFVLLFGVVDYGLVYKAVALMHQKDRLYEMWAESKIKGTTIVH